MVLTPPRALGATVCLGLALFVVHERPAADSPAAHEASANASDWRVPVPPAPFGVLSGANDAHAASAELVVRLSGVYRFHLEGTGATGTLRLGGDDAAVSLEKTDPGASVSSDWVELERGNVPIEVSLQRAGDGAARVRTLWERADDERGGFPSEPIRARSLERGEDADQRRLLAHTLALDEGRCAACHAGDPAKAAERRDAPNLTGAGARYGVAWLRAWITDPGASKPGTSMPRAFHGGDGDAGVVEDLVHYLAASGRDGSLGPAVATEESVLAEGRKLFHRIGCVACHGALESPAVLAGDEFLSDEVPDAAVPVPFGDLTGKWRLDALAAYLREPHTVRPSGRMPSLSATSSTQSAIRPALAAAETRAASSRPKSVSGNSTSRGAFFFRMGFRASARRWGVGVENRSFSK